MNFTIGENIEAVDQLGVWAVAKVIEKREASVVVTFPPWKYKWDREIVDPSEVRSKTQEDVLRRIYTTIILGTALQTFGTRADSFGHGPLDLHDKARLSFFNVQDF